MSKRAVRHYGGEVATHLGFDPKDVVSIRLGVNGIVVETLWRNREGKFEANAAKTRARRVLHVLRSTPEGEGRRYCGILPGQDLPRPSYHDLKAKYIEAVDLLREVSDANSDGEGGHESLWDAVDAFMVRSDADGG